MPSKGIDILLRDVDVEPYDDLTHDQARSVVLLGDAIGMTASDLNQRIALAIVKKSEGSSPRCLLVENVTPGFAWDIQELADELNLPISLAFIPSVRSARPMRPMSAGDWAEYDALRLSVQRWEQKFDECNRKLQKAYNQMRGQDRHLRRAQNQLLVATEDLSPLDPNDPNTFVLRPTRLAEITTVGRLSDDFIRIVFEIPTIHALEKMDKAWIDSAAYGRNTGSLSPAGYMAKKVQTLSDQLRRASRPSLRGSRRGADRVMTGLIQIMNDVSIIDQMIIDRMNYARLNRSKPARYRKSRVKW